MRLLPFVRRWLMRLPRRSLRDAIAFQSRAGDRAVLLVRVFYVAAAVMVAREAATWPLILASDAIDPQWPAVWIEPFAAATGVKIVLTLYTVVAAVVLLVPGRWPARAAYSLALLQYMAVVNGFGRINHVHHAWFLISVVLVAMPDRALRGDRTPAVRNRALSVFWVAQLLLMASYSLSGAWKVAFGSVGLLTSRRSVFEPDALASIVAHNLGGEDKSTVLGAVIHDAPTLGWLLFLGTMLVELGALVALFRPRLHRLWGAALVLFHLGTQLVLEIAFVEQAFLVGLLVVCSPAAPDRVTWREVVSDLPGAGLVRAATGRRDRGGLSVPR